MDLRQHFLASPSVALQLALREQRMLELAMGPAHAVFKQQEDLKRALALGQAVYTGIQYHLDHARAATLAVERTLGSFQELLRVCDQHRLQTVSTLDSIARMTDVGLRLFDEYLEYIREYDLDEDDEISEKPPLLRRRNIITAGVVIEIMRFLIDMGLRQHDNKVTDGRFLKLESLIHEAELLKEARPKLHITTTNVVFRAKPAIDKSNVIGGLPANTCVIVKAQDGDWLLVDLCVPETNRTTGWVYQEFVAPMLEGDGDDRR